MLGLQCWRLRRRLTLRSDVSKKNAERGKIDVPIDGTPTEAETLADSVRAGDGASAQTLIVKVVVEVARTVAVTSTAIEKNERSRQRGELGDLPVAVKVSPRGMTCRLFKAPTPA